MTCHVAPHETQPVRLAPLARLPVFLDLSGRRAVVVGANEGAAWKTELLAAAGAQVAVFAPAPCAQMLAVAGNGAAGGIALHLRRWREGDFDGAALVVAHTENDAENAALGAAARKAGAIVNLIDHPAASDVQFGTIVNRAPLTIAISTAGAAPVLGQAVRRRIEAALPRGLGGWTAAALRLRGGLKARLPDAGDRRRFWDRFAAAALGGGDAPASHDVDKLIAHTAQDTTTRRGRVTLVGAGPGDPELLTLKAVRALQGADVIVYDRLVGPAILELGRREARRIAVGKKGHGDSCRQSDINALLLDLAGQGLSVVRLKGGDPSLFGRAGEEIAACTAAGIAVTMVPGVTAALAAAAELRVSLSHRDHARRVQFVTGHDRHGRLAADLDFAALADPAATSCVYMGRDTIRAFAGQLLAHGLHPTTPAAAVENISLPDQRIIRTTLQDLAAEGLGPGGNPVMILVGAAIGATATAARNVLASSAA